MQSRIRPLGTGLHDCRGEGSKIVHLFGDDGMHDFKIQVDVFVNGHVAETDHLLHVLSQVYWKNSSSLQEREGITAVLRYPKLPLADHVHSKVDGCFTCTLKIENDGILLGLIGDKVLHVSCVFLLDAPKATLDAGGFVHDHVVSHTLVRAS